jgi:hypothetical protein
MPEKFINQENFASLVDVVEEKISKKAETREEIEERVKKEIIAKGQEFNKEGFEFFGQEIDKVNYKLIEPKTRVYPDKLPHNLDWKLFSENITKEEKEQLTSMFNSLQDYLGAFIITDNFTSHYDRGEWEKKLRQELSPAAWNCYKNNRLGLTNGFRPLAFSNYLTECQKDRQANDKMFIDPQVLSRLETFINMIPAEIKDGTVYGRTDLSRKIEIADKEMPLIFSAVIRTLGERIPKAKN